VGSEKVRATVTIHFPRPHYCAAPVPIFHPQELVRQYKCALTSVYCLASFCMRFRLVPVIESRLSWQIANVAIMGAGEHEQTSTAFLPFLLCTHHTNATMSSNTSPRLLRKRRRSDGNPASDAASSKRQRTSTAPSPQTPRAAAPSATTSSDLQATALTHPIPAPATLSMPNVEVLVKPFTIPTGTTVVVPATPRTATVQSSGMIHRTPSTSSGTTTTTQQALKDEYQTTYNNAHASLMAALPQIPPPPPPLPTSSSSSSSSSTTLPIAALVSRELEHERIRNFIVSALRRSVSSKGGRSMCM
jgi:hypothetical protein